MNFLKGLLVAFTLPFYLSFKVMGELMALGVPDSMAEVSKFEQPTATEGRTIPILFGTRMIKGPNLCGFQANGTAAVYTKIKVTPW